MFGECEKIETRCCRSPLTRVPLRCSTHVDLCTKSHKTLPEIKAMVGVLILMITYTPRYARTLHTSHCIARLNRKITIMNGLLVHAIAKSSKLVRLFLPRSRGATDPINPNLTIIR